MDEIQNRIATFGSEIRFNLLAVVKSRKDVLLERLQTTHDENEVAQIQDEIFNEECKMEEYRKENERRKHNFLPLAMKLLEHLAMKNESI